MEGNIVTWDSKPGADIVKRSGEGGKEGAGKVKC